MVKQYYEVLGIFLILNIQYTVTLTDDQFYTHHLH